MGDSLRLSDQFSRHHRRVSKYLNCLTIHGDLLARHRKEWLREAVTKGHNCSKGFKVTEQQPEVLISLGRSNPSVQVYVECDGFTGDYCLLHGEGLVASQEIAPIQLDYVGGGLKTGSESPVFTQRWSTGLPPGGSNTNSLPLYTSIAG